MADRIGVCEECAARYKIPPHITATRAKCKKCSGIVRIPPMDDAAAEDAPPAEKPARKPATRATRRAAPDKGDSEEKPARRRAGAAASGRAGATRRSRRGGDDEAEAGDGRRGAGGRRRAPAPAAGGNKNMIIAIVAGVAILGGGTAFFMMNDDDTENTEETAETEQNPEELVTEPEVPVEGASEETSTEAAEGNAEAEAGATEEAADTGGGIEASEATEEVPVEETIDTNVSFEDFPPFPGTTAEELEAITAAVGGMSLGGRARKRNMEKLLPFGLKAVPPLTNTFNGLDLANPEALRDAFEVATFVQDELTFGMVKIPLKGDYSEDLANLKHNVKTLESMIGYVKRWYDPTLGEANVIKSLGAFEKKKAEAAD